MTDRISRRTLLARAGALAGVGAGVFLTPGLGTLLADQGREFRIGACDWSLGKAGQITALELAEQIGLDGVEVSFNSGSQNNLRSEEVRQQYLAEAKRRNVEISSLAIGEMNHVPYATDPRAEGWVTDSIDVMKRLGVHVILLPFFMEGEIKGNDSLQTAVIQRLKRVAPKAEKAGVVLGLETALGADDHLRILDRVGSEAVRVYYDVSNMLRRGYDIYKEIPQLGDRICQLHMKEKGCLLGHGDVDFVRVRKAIEAIGYRGWLVIESARVNGRDVVDCYRENLAFLHGVFHGVKDDAGSGVKGGSA